MCRDYYNAADAIRLYISSINDVQNMHYSPRCPCIRGPITPNQAAFIDILDKIAKKKKAKFVSIMHIIYSGKTNRQDLAVAHAVQATIALINIATLSRSWYRAFTLVMSGVLAHISDWPPAYTAVCVMLNLAGCAISYHA
jgi:hypothetical protein